MLAVSILGILAGALFVGLTPAPAPNPMGGARQNLRKVQASLHEVQTKADEAENAVRQRTWTLPAEALGTRVMDDVGRIAERRHLQVANFQAGRTVDGGGLRQLSFTVTLEGAFSDVMGAMGELERPESRLALSNVALTPQSEAGGTVSATIGLTAFIPREDR